MLFRSGKDWDLARKDGGLIILPPYGEKDSGLYNSRLEALKGVTSFLKRADEEFVVMTDCDSVYRVNFNEIIEEHIRNKADVTLMYRKCMANENNADGAITLKVDADKRVSQIKFKENVKTGDLIFPNVYIMKKSMLENIVMDSLSHKNRHFTTEVLASNIKSMRIFGYEHKGYFACMNSLQAYYENSLDMLKDDVRHEIFGDRSVFTKIRDSAPTKYGLNAIVKNSLIADGCVIEGEVENSILFRGVKVARGTVIKNSIIMQNTVLGENVTLNCIITDKNVVIRDRKTLSGSENLPFYIGKGTMV